MQRMKQRISIDVVNMQKGRIPIRKIKKIVRDVLEAEERMGEISVVFVDDEKIKALNKRFRKNDNVTDVLAFPFRENQGEIIISLPTAKRQAKAYKNPFMLEIALLTIHGLLHILGYKHSKGMEEKQDFYLRRFKDEAWCKC